MDSSLAIILWLVGGLLCLIGFFAQVRLFAINDHLKQIRDELLIFRQERQSGSKFIRSVLGPNDTVKCARCGKPSRVRCRDCSGCETCCACEA